ncbi:MAG: SlyX family protein [Pirellulales bacterium]
MPPPDEGRLAERITALEELLTHVERVVGDLNQVLLSQQRRVEELEAQLQKLSAGVDSLTESLPTPPPDPEADRPPHY